MIGVAVKVGVAVSGVAVVLDVAVASVGAHGDVKGNGSTIAQWV